MTLLKFSPIPAVLGLALILITGSGAAAADAEGSAVVRSFYAALEATMKDGPSLKFQGRVERLKPAVAQAFEVAAMTRIASGAQWPSLKPEDQQRLIEAFGRFTAANYANNFDSYNGERFEVQREAPAPASIGAGVIVETRLIPASGDPVQLNYLLRPGNSGLRIIDVFVNGTISELAARRSEFASVLNSGGAQALYDQLVTKSEEAAPLK